MTVMRKSEVQTNYHRGGSGRPMVNIKVHNVPWDAKGWDHYAAEAARDSGGGEPIEGFDGAYLERIFETDEQIDGGWFGIACGDGLDFLGESAKELFGPNVKLYTDGRSGGWAVLEGLPDVESWDAIMLGKWAKFCRWARAAADNVPLEMAILVLLNRWERDMEDIARVCTALAVSPYILASV